MPRLASRLARALALVSMLSLLGASCHSSSGSSGSGHLQNGLFYMEPGAPDPLTCTSDTDCTADVVTKADGCCLVNNPYAQTRAWQAWLQKHTNAACAGVECSTAVHMAPPPGCATDVHCTAGRCADTCSAGQ
jgi:hypothetical protein